MLDDTDPVELSLSSTCQASFFDRLLGHLPVSESWILTIQRIVIVVLWCLHYRQVCCWRCSWCWYYASGRFWSGVILSNITIPTLVDDLTKNCSLQIVWAKLQ